MNSELVARLIKRALASAQEFTISATTCAALGLPDSESGLTAKQIAQNAQGGKHTFGVFLRDAPNDILVAFNRGATAELYLTDKSGALRVAAVREGSELHTIPNNEAIDGFRSEMEHFESLACDLPSTGTTHTCNETNKA